jgi:hypothetical protein
MKPANLGWQLDFFKKSIKHNRQYNPAPCHFPDWRTWLLI